jgi:hypothetical protein
MNKVLKYVVIFIVAVCFGGVVVVLFLPKTFDVTNELLINKPIAHCWEVLNDDSKRKEWIQGVDSIYYSEGTPGTEGAVRILHYKEDTNDVTVIETIMELDSPFHYKYTQESRPVLLMTREFRLVERDSLSTILTSKLHAESTNSMFKYFMFGIKKGVRVQVEQNLNHLKEIMEKGALEAKIKESTTLES